MKIAGTTNFVNIQFNFIVVCQFECLYEQSNQSVSGFKMPRVQIGTAESGEWERERENVNEIEKAGVAWNLYEYEILVYQFNFIYTLDATQNGTNVIISLLAACKKPKFVSPFRRRALILSDVSIQFNERERALECMHPKNTLGILIRIVMYRLHTITRLNDWIEYTNIVWYSHPLCSTWNGNVRLCVLHANWVLFVISLNHPARSTRAE